jgi:diguanylate cyclase
MPLIYSQTVHLPLFAAPVAAGIAFTSALLTLESSKRAERASAVRALIGAAAVGAGVLLIQWSALSGAFVGSSWDVDHSASAGTAIEERVAATVAMLTLIFFVALILERRSSVSVLEQQASDDRTRAIKLLDEQHIARLQNEALSREIRERQWMEARLLHLAFHDSLTALGNRAFMLDVLKNRHGSTHSGHRQPRYLMHIDLDRFRAVNDMLGPRAGDLLVKEIGARLEAFCSEEDVLVRMGGDEFAILFSKLHDPHQVARAADRILGIIEEPTPLAGMRFPVTASIGISEVNMLHAEPDEVLRAADTAMYRAKRDGGNRYAFYDTDMYDEALKATQTTLQLRSAIENCEFELYYEPLVDMRDLSIVGVEGLIRWHHPSRGLLSPGEFIRLAEESGYIAPMGAWALRQACGDIQAMRSVLGRGLQLSLNVSSRQLDDPSFFNKLLGLIDHCQTDPALLQLEITESVFLKDAERIGYLLQQVRALGVKIALDDFGTGYSSLSYLQRFPIDTLKIDQSFVRSMSKGSINAHIVRLLIDLARSTGMKITAEGVEHPEYAQSLLENGCYLAQGYLYSRPAPLEATLEMMKRGLSVDSLKVSET